MHRDHEPTSKALWKFNARTISSEKSLPNPRPACASRGEGEMGQCQGHVAQTDIGRVADAKSQALFLMFPAPPGARGATRPAMRTVIKPVGGMFYFSFKAIPSFLGCACGRGTFFRRKRFPSG